jgi:acyl carrier protein
MECALSIIWAALLKLEDVRPDDNVFTLGADSLLALEVVDTIEKRLGIELSPVACYEAPTVRLLAQMALEAMQV